VKCDDEDLVTSDDEDLVKWDDEDLVKRHDEDLVKCDDEDLVTLTCKCNRARHFRINLTGHPRDLMI
jgi:hypothetical protein